MSNSISLPYDAKRNECVFSTTFSITLPDRRVSSDVSYVDDPYVYRSWHPRTNHSFAFGPDGGWNLEFYTDREVAMPDDAVTMISRAVSPAYSVGSIVPGSPAISEPQDLYKGEYVEVIFTARHVVTGSISMSFSTPDGEVLKYASTPAISGNEHRARYVEDNLCVNRRYIIITVCVKSSAFVSDYPLYNPLHVTDLISRMMDGESAKDVKFVLYNAVYGSDVKAAWRDLKPVYTDQQFLSSNCQYFADCRLSVPRSLVDHL